LRHGQQIASGVGCTLLRDNSSIPNFLMLARALAMTAVRDGREYSHARHDITVILAVD
jgi:hypothetical protein